MNERVQGEKGRNEVVVGIWDEGRCERREKTTKVRVGVSSQYEVREGVPPTPPAPPTALPLPSTQEI